MNVVIIFSFFLYGIFPQYDYEQREVHEDYFTLLAENTLLPECDSLIVSIDANTKSSNTKKPNDKLTITKEEYIKLVWTHSDKYKGKFYIQIMNMYDEVFDTFSTKKSKLTLDLNPYNGKIILFRIFSEDCHVSAKKGIQVNIPEKK